MSRVPLGATRAVGQPYGPGMLGRYGVEAFDQGPGAELMAKRWNLSRQQLDEFALASHQKAAAATDAGAFDAQLVPLPSIPDLEYDEGIRRESSLEKLASLKPVFQDDGVVTAGNASQISDGAAGVIVTTPERAAELGLRPLARLHSGVAVGDDPVMNTKPVAAFLAPHAAVGLERLSENGVAGFRTPESCADAIRAWSRWSAPAPRPEADEAVQSSVRRAVAALGSARPNEYESAAIFNALGITTAASAIIRDVDPGSSLESPIGYPVVAKILSADVPHKTDAGGVVLGISDAVELAVAVKVIRANVAERHPDAIIDGVLVQSMGCHVLAPFSSRSQHPTNAR